VRQAASFLVVYLLFLVQVGAGPAFPDLAFVAVVVLALHELPLVTVLLAGFLGLLFDGLAVDGFGLHTAAFALVGHAVASVRRYIYRVAWATPLVVVLALAVRWAVRLGSSPTLPALLDALVAVVLTLAFIPVADWFVTRVVFAGWNPD
jgi:cell shape-determining protein MreD